MPKSAQCLVWVDAETTDLPKGNDFSDVHVLEVAAIVTDFDLEKYAGFHSPIKLTKAAADSLRANDYTREMHQKNGLIRDCAGEDASDLASVEAQIIQMLKDKTTFDKGEFMLAGSGVASFDFPLIKAKMPELASWLTYYTFDIGVMRRTANILAGKNVVNPIPRSYDNDVKEHRAWDDVLAHIEEAERFRTWFRSVS
jgi:oligoribonuclease (3'-5' exoribonuclease)